jgi:hypothetical protein
VIRSEVRCSWSRLARTPEVRTISLPIVIPVRISGRSAPGAAFGKNILLRLIFG